MLQNKFLFLSFGLFFALILAGCQQITSKYDELAGCLTEKGVKMYGTEWCSHCRDQKEIFGASFKKIDYIDCDIKSWQCKSAGVSGYPAWIFTDGTKLAGTQSIATLAEKSGCELPE